MNTLSPANTNYLLEVSLEDLHRESDSWLSKIDYWKIEVAFFQRLLDKIDRRISSGEDKKGVDHFQNLILYFRGELLGQLKHDIRQHERYLSHMLHDKARFNEQMYREVHKKYETQMRNFDRDFREYKKDLFSFSERFI